MAASEEEVLDAGSSALTLEEKLERGNALKAEGNEFFKQKQYKNAMKKYHRALLFVLGLVDQPSFIQQHTNSGAATEEQTEKAHQVQLSCYNNLAACLLKEERWDKAVDNCNKVLNIKPGNAKALFRRGQCYFYLKDFDSARTDLKAAEELEPKDAGIKKMLAVLNAELKKIKETEKRIYAGMFDKLASKDAEVKKKVASKDAEVKKKLDSKDAKIEKDGEKLDSKDAKIEKDEEKLDSKDAEIEKDFERLVGKDPEIEKYVEKLVNKGAEIEKDFETLSRKIQKS